jgi:predicted dehydrogenase
VLSGADGVELVFLVDPNDPGPAPDVPHRVPLHPTLAAALADHGDDADLLVLATPTDTHLDLAARALVGSRATVLSEKPLTRDAAALARFEADHAALLPRLRVVNHFAFSPEVDWAADVVARAGWGPPYRVLSTFNDPYVRMTPGARRSYVSSWVDSGSNQLSMLTRFADGWRVRRHDEDRDGLRSVTELSFDGGAATLASNWWTGDSSKQTVLRWQSGHELFLDHTAMTGLALSEGRVEQHLGHDGTVDRKTAHYAAMYAALLGGAEQHLLGLPLARTVAELLSSASSRTASDDAGPRWLTGAG